MPTAPRTQTEGRGRRLAQRPRQTVRRPITLTNEELKKSGGAQQDRAEQLEATLVVLGAMGNRSRH